MLPNRGFVVRDHQVIWPSRFTRKLFRSIWSGGPDGMASGQEGGVGWAGVRSPNFPVFCRQLRKSGWGADGRGELDPWLRPRLTQIGRNPSDHHGGISVPPNRKIGCRAKGGVRHARPQWILHRPAGCRRSDLQRCGTGTGSAYGQFPQESASRIRRVSRVNFLAPISKEATSRNSSRV